MAKYIFIIFCISLPGIIFISCRPHTQNSNDESIIIEEDSVYKISSDFIVIEGNLVRLSGSKVIQYGHCWSDSPEPDVDDNKTQLGTTEITGSFLDTLKGLNPGAVYYARTYVTNAEGTYYGLQKKIVTLRMGSRIDDSEENAGWTTEAVQEIDTKGKGVEVSLTEDRLIRKRSESTNTYNEGNDPVSEQKVNDKRTKSKSASVVSTKKQDKIFSESESPIKPKNKDDRKAENNISFTTKTQTEIGKTNVNGNKTVVSDEKKEIKVDPIQASVKAKSEGKNTTENKDAETALSQIDVNEVDKAVKKTGAAEKSRTLEEKSTTKVDVDKANIQPVLKNEIDKRVTKGSDNEVSVDKTVVAKETDSESTGDRSEPNRIEGLGNTVETAEGSAKIMAEVSTDGHADINYRSAVCKGNVSSPGGLTVIQRGVCISSKEIPDKNDIVKLSGKGTGTFSCKFEKLKSGTKYYYRAFAITENGTSYGEPGNFTTFAYTKAILDSLTVNSIDCHFAECEGKVLSNGGTPVTERGICWADKTNPDINDNKIVTGEGTGGFTSVVSRLTPDKKYYLRPYAINSLGISYGTETILKTASCGKTLTDARDKRVYGVVQIGDQCWMSENLAHLPSVSDSTRGSYNDPHYYVKGYFGTIVDSAKVRENYRKYGALYNWPAAMNGAQSTEKNPSEVKGVCPEGWHLPSDEEWKQLIDYLGGTIVAGEKLKHPEYPGDGPSDEPSSIIIDFKALPGGRRFSNGKFESDYDISCFVSATEFNSSFIKYWRIRNNYSVVSHGIAGKDGGFSVRCLKD